MWTISFQPVDGMRTRMLPPLMGLKAVVFNTFLAQQRQGPVKTSLKQTS